MSLYKTCPFCGNNIDAQATRCAFCKKLLYEVEEKSIPPEIRVVQSLIGFLLKAFFSLYPPKCNFNYLLSLKFRLSSP